MLRKGIILAGGRATRLMPATTVVSKGLLPIHDKPMIYYPLSTLMLGGVRDIALISTPRDLPSYEALLGDGLHLGIKITYFEQAEPRGIAEAFLITEEWIGRDSVSLILGDNIFYGVSIDLEAPEVGAKIYACHVPDPERFGVVSFDDTGRVIDVVEKPKNPKSNYAIMGLYAYDNQVVEAAKSIRPSDRGELEITDINNWYLQRGQLQVRKFRRDLAWIDTGTPDSLTDASSFIRSVEQRLGLKIACPEEIAWRLNYITDDELVILASNLNKSDYGKYLCQLLTQVDSK
jgi:glucose-1-phosphate thymidylyltransferase